MFILFLLAFTLVYNLLFKQPKTSKFILKAVPAYVNKKRFRQQGRIRLPDNIPTYFY